MSEYSDEDYEDEGTEAQGPKALRDALAKSKKAEKDALKRLADLEAKQAEYDKANRATMLKEALKAAGGDAATKVAAFFPSDTEVTADAVKSWLDENKDVFNLGAKAQEAEGEPAGEEQREPVPPAVQEWLDAQKRGDALEGDRVAAPQGETKLLAAIDEAYKNAKNPTEYIQAIEKLGAPVANSGYRTG